VDTNSKCKAEYGHDDFDCSRIVAPRGWKILPENTPVPHVHREFRIVVNPSEPGHWCQPRTCISTMTSFNAMVWGAVRAVAVPDRETLITWLHPTNTRNGPKLTTERGELRTAVLSCTGCVHQGIHDRHYTYCSAQYAPNQEPSANYAYPWFGAGVHLRSIGPSDCPYPAPTEVTD
jgi:hypothetical protein